MILFDANVIVYYLHRVGLHVFRVKQVIVNREGLVVTLSVVYEVVFTLIRLEVWIRLAIILYAWGVFSLVGCLAWLSR